MEGLLRRLDGAVPACRGGQLLLLATIDGPAPMAAFRRSVQTDLADRRDSGASRRTLATLRRSVRNRATRPVSRDERTPNRNGLQQCRRTFPSDTSGRACLSPVSARPWSVRLSQLRSPMGSSRPSLCRSHPTAACARIRFPPALFDESSQRCPRGRSGCDRRCQCA